MKTVSVRRRTPSKIPKPSRLGRPTKEESEKRQEELLDAAVDVFLEMGYHHATMELIATAVGMTKRTIYSRYTDKAALFRATVQRAITRNVDAQADDLRNLELGDLEDTLAAAARLRITQMMSPAGTKLQRIINAEVYRFPEIFAMAHEQITRPVVEALGRILARHVRAGSAVVSKPEMAAAAFMSMVISGPIRVAAFSSRPDDASIERRIRYSVNLFLDGIRPGRGAKPRS